MINMKMTGARDVLNRINKFGGNAERLEKQAVYATANAIRNDAIKSIQQKSNGGQVTRYSQGGKPFSHTVSKPYAAPNTDTGNLVRSINIEPMQPSKKMYVGVNTDNPNYGVFLEFGTRNMIKRPFMQPAMEENKYYLEQYLLKRLRELVA